MTARRHRRKRGLDRENGPTGTLHDNLLVVIPRLPAVERGQEEILGHPAEAAQARCPESLRVRIQPGESPRGRDRAEKRRPLIRVSATGSRNRLDGQVFWLPDRPTSCAFPRLCRSGVFAAFVPGYSGGTATDLHRLPYSSAGPEPADTRSRSRPSYCVESGCQGGSASPIRTTRMERNRCSHGCGAPLGGSLYRAVPLRSPRQPAFPLFPLSLLPITSNDARRTGFGGGPRMRPQRAMDRIQAG